MLDGFLFALCFFAGGGLGGIFISQLWDSGNLWVTQNDSPQYSHLYGSKTAFPHLLHIDILYHASMLYY